MKFMINVPDEETQFLTEKAIEELIKEVEEHARVVIGEAAKLEAGSRNRRGQIEITSHHIQEASKNTTKITIKKKNLNRQIIVIVNIISSAFLGFIYDIFIKEPSNSVYLLSFTIIILLFALTTVLNVHQNG